MIYNARYITLIMEREFMPPKAKLTKRQILESALLLIEEKGGEYLTAKHLADYLSSSTQPIFSHFSSMDELKSELFTEALKIFGKALREEVNCDNRYLALGLNYIHFAQKQPHLFRYLFMSDYGKKDLVKEQVEMNYILEVIKEEKHLTGEKAVSVYRDMWLFSHGIAVMMVTGTANFAEEEIRNMLIDACRAFVMWFEHK